MKAMDKCDADCVKILKSRQRTQACYPDQPQQEEQGSVEFSDMTGLDE